MPCPAGTDGRPVVAKTGMGSSAALVTSLVGAILQYTGAIDLGASDVPKAGGPLTGEAARRLLHNTAQAAHNLAQGKVGSGFDVCSAVFGSTHFVRAPRSVLEKHMALLQERLGHKEEEEQEEDVAAAGAGARTDAGTGSGAGAGDAAVAADRASPDAFVAAFTSDWGFGIAPLQLPPGLDLAMGDVHGGSETPSMVRKVLAWRGEGGEEAGRIWAGL